MQDSCLQQFVSWVASGLDVREAITLRAARLALACEDDARRQAIADALARELLWLLPDDRQTVVTVCAGQVSVAFGPAPTLPPLVKEDRP